MADIIQFPIRMQGCDAFTARAAELREEARELVDAFPPESVAAILAYAAARLEPTGFLIF